MSNDSEMGRIVWHDLLTNDVDAAARFYKSLLGWNFEVEHAADFVWKKGEADYPLIMAGGVAHGGFVDADSAARPLWVAFVATRDVDAVSAKAKTLGARISREPFEIPGVGRASVIRDTEGAVICPYVCSHAFPAPSGTFLWDELITGNIESAARFYGELFSWSLEVDVGPTGNTNVFKNANGDTVAGVAEAPADSATRSTWLPYLAIKDMTNGIARARALGATLQSSVTDAPAESSFARFVDPGGARFGLLTKGKRS